MAIPAKKLHDNEYVMVHGCCERGNFLSRPLIASDKKVKFIDITRDEDFTRRETVDSVIQSIRGPGDIFFFYSPCTGGSIWQRLNLA